MIQQHKLQLCLILALSFMKLSSSEHVSLVNATLRGRNTASSEIHEYKMRYDPEFEGIEMMMRPNERAHETFEEMGLRCVDLCESQDECKGIEVFISRASWKARCWLFSDPNFEPKRSHDSYVREELDDRTADWHSDSGYKQSFIARYEDDGNLDGNLSN